MPKNLYYSDVKLIKKPLKYKLKCLLIFFLIVLVFVGTFGVAVFFSEALSTQNISNIFIFGSSKIKLKAHSFYAVTLGEYDNLPEAQQVAIGSSVLGGSGYIWNDGSYFVIGSIYTDNKDAEKVLENLKDSNYNVGVKAINFPKRTLNFVEYENKECATIKKSIDFFDKIYQNLYDYSIGFDSGKLNNLGISSYTSTLRGENKVLISSVQNILKKPNDNVEIIQENLIKLDEVLNQTIIKTIDNSATNYILKNSLACVVQLKYDMLNSLSDN